MRPKCLILLVAAAAMVVVSPSLSAAKSNKQPSCDPFLINSTTPVTVSTAYRGKNSPYMGNEITLLVNTTSPSFALKIGPTLSNFTFDLSDASDTLRLPQDTGSWPESLSYLSLRFSSQLFNGTFELGSSGNSQFNVCVGGLPDLQDMFYYDVIFASKVYRKATESTAGTDLATEDNRTCRGSTIKTRGHFPVTVTVVIGYTGEEGSEEEVTVTAPKLFSYVIKHPPANIIKLMLDAVPGCHGGNFYGPSMQSNWLKKEFGMDGDDM